jgi:5-methylthioadenosine/S-adenosylhomocysteine deaminase
MFNEVIYMKILIKNIDELYTVNDNDFILNNAYIIIDKNKIKEYGKTELFTYNEKNFDRIIDAEGKIVLPGLINTHTHAAMTLLRGYADDLPLKEWLENKIWPFESKLKGSDIYWGSMLAIIEMIKNGITTFTDMYFQMNKVAKAVKESGIRAVLSQGLIEANDGLKGLEEASAFFIEWNNNANGRITTMLAPHAPYTCTPDFLKRIINISNEQKSAINIHLAETKWEKDFIYNKYKMTPTALLNNIDLFKRPTIAAHCIFLDDNDIDILAENNVGVSYNPKSNMKLADGIARIEEMIKKGINVGLGTDGVASNNRLDLIEEARIGSYLQKVRYMDPTVLNTHSILKMLTINGAKAIKIMNLGKIKKGYLADLILVDIKESSNYYPHHNNLSNLLYAGSGNDVDTVIVDGNILMEKRNLLTIDVEKIYYEIEKRVERLV